MLTCGNQGRSGRYDIRPEADYERVSVNPLRGSDCTSKNNEKFHQQRVFMVSCSPYHGPYTSHWLQSVIYAVATHNADSDFSA